MDDFGLSSIHNWLWAELDNLGIDSVIYSRHILDLFISSKYSTDYYLAKKEKSIFDHIVPTSRKRKHRYTRRSNSFSNTGTEEVAWKKQIAISCLKSAVDSSETNTMKSIQRLVDEIYTKLTDLRLTPDSMQKESQPSNDEKPKKKGNKENYDQAFPTLSPPNTQPSFVNDKNTTPWTKSTVFNDSHLRPLSKLPLPNDQQHVVSVSSPSPTGTRKKEHKKSTRKPNFPSPHKPLKEKSRSSCNSKVSRPNPYKYQKNSRRKTSSHPFADKHQKHAPKPVKGRGKVQTKNKVKSRTFLTPTTYPEFGKRAFNGHNFNAPKQEATSRYKFARHNYDDNAQSSIEVSKLQSAALQSKWFRDPETGLLTFEPGNQSEKTPSAVNAELNDLGVLGDPKCTESWMWCPSPSFWAEDSEKQSGSCKSSTSTSRLHSVYQNNEEADKAVDKITGKFWREYQEIFSTLDDDTDSRSADVEDDDSVFNDVSNDSLFASEDSTDYLLVGFSVGLNLFSADSVSSEQSTGTEGKSKFADFFNNPELREKDEVDRNPWNKREDEAKVSIWNNNNDNTLGELDGEFSEETLEILLNPGNFNSFKSDLNAYLFSGCLNWLNVCPNPQSYHMYNQNHFNLEMDCGSSKFEKYFHSNSLETRSWKHEDLPFIEAVTNNDAWKTSLRIGNVWQSISGIRPVVVIYNERMQPPEEQSVVPTDMTHFRPIHKSDTMRSSKFDQQDVKNAECLKPIAKEIGIHPNFSAAQACDMNNFQVCPSDDLEDDFTPKFKKLGQDKCLQTTFEKDFQKLIHERQNLRQ